MSKEDLISLISGVVGAIIGVLWGPIGAILGALVAWGVPFIFFKTTESYRLKNKILKTLTTTEVMQVRDVMILHEIIVPTDCFPYNNDLPFIRELIKYRQAFSELEWENKVIHNKQQSVIHGYVDPPFDWVNEWSVKTYQKAPMNI